MRSLYKFLLKKSVLKGLTISLLGLALIFTPLLTYMDGIGGGSAEATVSQTYAVADVPTDGGESTDLLQQGEDYFFETFVAAVIFVGSAVIKSLVEDKSLLEVVKVNGADNIIGIELTVDDIEMESHFGGFGPIDPSVASKVVIKNTLEGALRFDNPTGQPQIAEIGGGISELCFDLQAQASLDEKAEASYDFILESPEDGILFTSSFEVKASDGSADSKQDCVPIPELNMTIPAFSSKELRATLVNQGLGQSGPVGGIVDLVTASDASASVDADSSSSVLYTAIAIAAGAIVALAVGNWYVRRRWMR